MNLRVNPMIEFQYFNQAHIIYFSATLLLAAFLLAFPLFCSYPKEAMGRVLGFIIIILNMFEIFYRIAYEEYALSAAMPFHICGISVFVAGIYLISRKDVFFQITYYYTFGAVLALILPGIDSYQHPLYFQLFMLNHMLVIIGCAYGLIWLNARPTLHGLKLSIILTLVLCPIIYVYNSIYFTNFMFMNYYLIPKLSFITPFWFYQASLIMSIISVMICSYLLFRKKARLIEGTGTKGDKEL